MHKQQQQQKQALQRSIKTFALQEKLPRLPIPKLEDTVRKYVKSVEPLTTAPELAQVRLKSQSFLEKEGPVLQQRLEEYGKRQKVMSPITYCNNRIIGWRIFGYTRHIWNGESR